MKGLQQAYVAPATPSRQRVQDKYDRYCSQPLIRDCEEPIQWWLTEGKSRYLYLAKMALDLLSIPAMSDEPERIFSRLGWMISDRRNGLQYSTIQAVQCLYSWDHEGLINLRKRFVE
jgi:hypothetical protein